MRPAPDCAEPRRPRSFVATELRWAVGGAIAGVFLLGVTVVACGPPPIGWQGAGRLQSLPSPQPDAGPPTTDSGIDTGTIGNDDTGSDDSGFDAGGDAADDSGSDATSDALEDSADDSGSPGTDAHAHDGAAADGG